MNHRDTFGWGILGTGRITHQFARDAAHVPGARLAAVCSRRAESAQAFATQYAIAAAYDNYQAMLSDPAVDVVYIASPHTLHREGALQAMQAGKAVLCEKPLTVTPSETEDLLVVSEQTGVYLMEAMWTWFLPAIRQALAWVEEGRIGNLRHLAADFGYPQLPYDPNRREYDARLGGGCLLEMGVYPVALNWLFLKQDPDQLQVLSHAAPNGVEDHVSWNMVTGGVTSSLATSFRCRLGNRATLVGEQGRIEIPDFFRAGECQLYELDTLVEHFRDDRKGAGFEFEIAAAQNDVLEGRRQSAVVTHADSLAFQRHMAAIKEAS